MDDQKQNTNQIPLVLSALFRKKRAQTNLVAFNQRGSVLLVCLAVMPLVLSALIATSAIVWFLHAKNELLYLCEAGLLESQTQLVLAENELLKLNSPIKALVQEKKLLTRALALSPTPAERLVIQSQLIKIKIQLSLYQKRQKSLWFTAHSRSQINLQKVAVALQKRLFYFQKQWAAHLRVQIKKTNPLLQLEPQHIDPLAIIYTVPPQFEKKQTQTIQWSLLGQTLFPSWVGLLHSKKFYWQDSCSSRPHKKENNLWTSELGAGTS